MIPKVEACLETLGKGVRKIHIIDGRLRHSLLLEIYTNKGVGTEIVRDDSRSNRARPESEHGRRGQPRGLNPPRRPAV